MYCKNCGSQIDDNAVFCPHCGVATDNYNALPPKPQTKTNTIAIVGFILSFFIALAGLICSIIGYRNSRDLNGAGRGFALAGIIISSAEMALTIIVYAVTIISLGF